MKQSCFDTRIIQVYNRKALSVRGFVRRGWFKRLVCDKYVSHRNERFLKRSELVETERAALKLAMRLHEFYLEASPSYKYTTEEDSRKFDTHSSMGHAMFSVCFDLITDRPGLESKTR